jgi:hypothetical protein
MALRNLQRSLDIAIRSRRKDDGDFLIHGALFELVGEEWAISEAGLECPTRGYLVSETDFMDEPPPLPLPSPNRAAYEQCQPQRPDWVEGGLWQILVARAKPHFPIRRGPVAMIPRWAPLTKTPRELGLLS